MFGKSPIMFFMSGGIFDHLFKLEFLGLIIININLAQDFDYTYFKHYKSYLKGRKLVNK